MQTREQKVKEEDKRTMSKKLSTAEQELVERKRLLEQMKAQQAKGIFQQRNDHKSGLPQCSKCARRLSRPQCPAACACACACPRGCMARTLTCPRARVRAARCGLNGHNKGNRMCPMFAIADEIDEARGDGAVEHGPMHVREVHPLTRVGVGMRAVHARRSTATARSSRTTRATSWCSRSTRASSPRRRRRRTGPRPSTRSRSRRFTTSRSWAKRRRPSASSVPTSTATTATCRRAPAERRAPLSSSSTSSSPR